MNPIWTMNHNQQFLDITQISLATTAILIELQKQLTVFLDVNISFQQLQTISAGYNKHTTVTMTIYVVVSLKSHLISGPIFIFTSLLPTSPYRIHPMEGGRHGELTAYIIKNQVQATFPNSNLNCYETTAFMFLCRGYNSTSKQWTSITKSLGQWEI